MEGRPIVFLVDEIYDKDLIDVPEEDIRLVLVMNPKSDEKRSLMLDFSHLPFLSSQPISPYLKITLTTIYRTTRAVPPCPLHGKMLQKELEMRCGLWK